jgi:hypothetical protein
MGQMWVSCSLIKTEKKRMTGKHSIGEPRINKKPNDKFSFNLVIITREV